MLDEFADVPERKRKRKLLEGRDIEQPSCRWAGKQGWWQRKFRTPGNRAAPDRMFCYKNRIIFIEFKLPGKEPTGAQLLYHAEMRAAGMEVYVRDNVAATKELLARIKAEVDMKYESFTVSEMEVSTISVLADTCYNIAQHVTKYEKQFPGMTESIKADMLNFSAELQARLQKLPLGLAEKEDEEDMSWLD